MNTPERLSTGSRLKFLAKDSVIYGVGGAVNKALTLITFPLLARHFSVIDYGVIDLLTAWTALIVVWLIFGQDSAVARYFYEDVDTPTRRQTLSQSLTCLCAVMIVALPPAWLAAEPLARWVGLERPDSVALIRLAILQAPFFVFASFAQGMLKWTLQRWKFLFISIGMAVVTLGGLVIGMVFFDLTVVAVFIVYLITRAIFAVFGLWFIREWLTWPSGWARLRRILPFAIPYGVICIIASLIPVLERSLVDGVVGPVALGLYAAGAKVAMLMMLPINAIETSWGPFSVMLHREAGIDRTYSLVLRIICLLMFSAVLGLTAIADFTVSLLASARYEGAGVVTFALAMALAVQLTGTVAGAGIVFAKRSYLLLYGYLAMLVVAGAAIPLLATSFGMVGVAWGSLMGMTAKALVEAWLGQRAHPIAWRYRGALILGAATLVVGLVHQMASDLSIPGGIAPVPLIGLALLWLLAWFTLFDTAERNHAFTLARGIVKGFRGRRACNLP